MWKYTMYGEERPAQPTGALSQSWNAMPSEQLTEVLRTPIASAPYRRSEGGYLTFKLLEKNL